MKILVTAKPGAKTEKVEKIGDNHFAVFVKERAKEGEANKAIEKALADHFGVKPYEVEIVSGHMAKNKLVEIVE